MAFPVKPSFLHWVKSFGTAFYSTPNQQRNLFVSQLVAKMGTQRPILVLSQSLLCATFQTHLFCIFRLENKFVLVFEHIFQHEMRIVQLSAVGILGEELAIMILFFYQRLLSSPAITYKERCKKHWSTERAKGGSSKRRRKGGKDNRERGPKTKSGQKSGGSSTKGQGARRATQCHVRHRSRALVVRSARRHGWIGVWSQLQAKADWKKSRASLSDTPFLSSLSALIPGTASGSVSAQTVLD